MGSNPIGSTNFSILQNGYLMEKTVMSTLLSGTIIFVSCCLCFAGQKKQPAQDTAFCDLVAAPEAFLGKPIRVRAVYTYMDEISRLAPTSCCPKHEPKVWVELDRSNLDRHSRGLLSLFPEGMGDVLATFIGTIEDNGPYGDGGYRLKFTVDRIVSVEEMAKPSTKHRPTWFPTNCN